MARDQSNNLKITPEANVAFAILRRRHGLSDSEIMEILIDHLGHLDRAERRKIIHSIFSNPKETASIPSHLVPQERV